MNVRVSEVAADASEALARLGVKLAEGGHVCRSPITGEAIAHIAGAGPSEVADAVERAHRAFLDWRVVPAPRRGELVRRFGEALRAAKTDLGRLVTLEAGKTISEGQGEVQEMIDICDFAVGLSRQLYGLTLATERHDHRMMETWKPLGAVGVITAFNFPVAVWAWNGALALVCGDTLVWKPSEKTPLTALAVQAIFERARADFPEAPSALSQVVVGGRAAGEALVDHPRAALVSATGSTGMGRDVGARLARRFGRALLELGGNNAAIVCPSADQDLALRAVAFAALGTAGQRCTSLRRLFVHRTILGAFVARLKGIYGSVGIGDPREPSVLVGPLIDEAAAEAMARALADARASGARVTGGERLARPGAYVRPALVETETQIEAARRETFAPILYVTPYDELADAIGMQNDVAQGLSSSIFTLDMREAELFVSERGSDCGIANVNIGPSGAEIGGAFGGEKETGGGREAGSDAWKTYMRRQTTTVNYGRTLPLAQGVTFEI